MLLLRMLLLRLLLLRQCSADCTASVLVASLGARRASLLFLCEGAAALLIHQPEVHNDARVPLRLESQPAEPLLAASGKASPRDPARRVRN